MALRIRIDLPRSLQAEALPQPELFDEDDNVEQAETARNLGFDPSEYRGYVNAHALLRNERLKRGRKLTWGMVGLKLCDIFPEDGPTHEDHNPEVAAAGYDLEKYARGVQAAAGDIYEGVRL